MTTAPVTKKNIFIRPEKAYVNPYLGGVILGIVLFLAFFLTGNGLGSSGATSRIDALIVDAIAPSHVDNNPYLLKMAGGDFFAAKRFKQLWTNSFTRYSGTSHARPNDAKDIISRLLRSSLFTTCFIPNSSQTS